MYSYWGYLSVVQFFPQVEHYPNTHLCMLKRPEKVIMKMLLSLIFCI